MLSILRGIRIVTVGIAVADPAVTAVIDDLDALAAGRIPSGLHRVALALVVRGIALGVLASDGPAAIARYNVNIFLGHGSISLFETGVDDILQTVAAGLVLEAKPVAAATDADVVR